MFETVEKLSKTLPRPAVTGDTHRDAQIQRQYMMNAMRMRSEAFACHPDSFPGVIARSGADDVDPPEERELRPSRPAPRQFDQAVVEPRRVLGETAGQKRRADDVEQEIVVPRGRFERLVRVWCGGSGAGLEAKRRRGAIHQRQVEDRGAPVL